MSKVTQFFQQDQVVRTLTTVSSVVGLILSGRNIANLAKTANKKEIITYLGAGALLVSAFFIVDAMRQKNQTKVA